MSGTYHMATETGEAFDIEIRPFRSTALFQARAELTGAR